MKIERILLTVVVTILAVLFVLGFIATQNAIDQGNNKAALEQQAELIELAKQDIISEYQWEAVIWLDAEKHKNLEGRDDFYIISCLVEEDELILYRLAVTIREVNGEIDVDTWLIREGE